MPCPWHIVPFFQMTTLFFNPLIYTQTPLNSYWVKNKVPLVPTELGDIIGMCKAREEFRKHVDVALQDMV